MLKILDARGLHRRREQTPREFALAAGGRLPQDAVDAPKNLTDLFYEVRFGHRQPNPEQLAEIERQLDRLSRLDPDDKGAPQ
jgi:hypothetical protein